MSYSDNVYIISRYLLNASSNKEVFPKDFLEIMSLDFRPNKIHKVIDFECAKNILNNK